jgi:hypothetical protein
MSYRELEYHWHGTNIIKSERNVAKSNTVLSGQRVSGLNSLRRLLCRTICGEMASPLVQLSRSTSKVGMKSKSFHIVEMKDSLYLNRLIKLDHLQVLNQEMYEDKATTRGFDNVLTLSQTLILLVLGVSCRYPQILFLLDACVCIHHECNSVRDRENIVPASCTYSSKVCNQFYVLFLSCGSVKKVLPNLLKGELLYTCTQVQCCY